MAEDVSPMGQQAMIASVRRLAWSSWQQMAKRAARAYVAGPELEDALRVCRMLSQQDIATTICRWDGDGESPRFVADSYLEALAGVGGAGLDCYLSIKAPPLEFSRELVGSILETARLRGIEIHFDSLAPEAAEDTWSLISEVATRYPPVGCTLPARWRRSQRDVNLAIDLGLRVRLVKGQWADTEEATVEVRRAYMRLVEQLAGRAARVAVATHDSTLAQSALECLRSSGTACELELLYGFPVRDTVRRARAMGVPIRFYVPYGHAWLPYCLSQVKQHPGILIWMLRDWMLRRRWPVGSRRTESDREPPFASRAA